ncbi:unnamed protein product [Urochloa humidicola]
MSVSDPRACSNTYYPAMSSCGPGEPLLLVQVTEFSCGGSGGFVLGVTWNHGVADGAGMGQFLRAVGELASAGTSPSITPVRWVPSLPSLPPRVLEAQRHMLSLVDPLTDDLAALDITIPMESIDRVRADFSSSFHGQQPPCMTFEAALAVLWRCRTRAIGLAQADPATPVLLVFVADRRHVGAEGGYYGNCIAEQFVVAESGAVADGEVRNVVMAIRRAKDRIPELLMKAEGVVGAQEMCKVRSYETLTVTSWRNLGFEQVDFGGGRPARVTGSGKDLPPSPGAVGFMCDRRGGGVSVLSALVREEHADAFLAELAKFM